MKSHDSWIGALFALLLISASVLAYLPGTRGPFLFDDYPNIVTNALVQPATWNRESFFKALHGYQAGIIGRPLATLWFAQDFLTSGKNAIAFKISNLQLHAVNSGLVFWFLTLLTCGKSLPSNHRWTIPGSFAIAAAWALHPYQVSTVLYVVQRMEMLVATFTLAALIAYLYGRTRQIEGRPHGLWLLLLSAMLSVTGLMAKESAILIPIALFLIEISLFRFSASNAKCQRTFRQLSVVIAAVYCVFMILLFAYHFSLSPFPGRTFTPIERVLTQSRVLCEYLGQIVVPRPAQMTFYYDDWIESKGLFRPLTTLFSFVALIALLILAIFQSKRRVLFSFGIFWFLGMHVLTSGPLNLELVFEHRNYLPMLGILISIGALTRELLDSSSHAMKAAIVILTLGGLTSLTLIRSATWGEELLLSSYLAAKNPDSARAASDLGTLYIGMSNGDSNSPFFQFGTQEFERAMTLPSASPLPESALILSHASYNLPADSRWWQSLNNKLIQQPAGVQQNLAVQGLLSARLRGVEMDDLYLSKATHELTQRFPTAQNYLLRAYYELEILHDPTQAQASFRHFAAAPDATHDWRAKVAGELKLANQSNLAEAVLGVERSTH